MTAPTAQTMDLDRLRSDLRRYAEIAEVPFDASAVDRVITTLADLFTPDCWMGIRTTTKPVSSRDVNLRLNTQAQPIPLLREAGLLTYQGHPIENLADQMEKRFAARVTSLDTSIKGAVDKIWLGSSESIPLADFLSLPDLPPAVRAASAHFERAGIDKVGLVGLNFTNHVINLYRAPFPVRPLTSDQVRAILTGLDFPLPPEEEIQRNATAFNLYQTFSWESPDVLRVCFPHWYSAAEFPTHCHPLLNTFVEQAPMLNDKIRDFGLYNTYGASGRYYKIQADYAGTHRAIHPHHYSQSAAPQQ